jgi:hypothetical protein
MYGIKNMMYMGTGSVFSSLPKEASQKIRELVRPAMSAVSHSITSR